VAGYAWGRWNYISITTTVSLASLPGARYTNLRDIKRFERIGFIDIDWKNYNFKAHLNAVKSVRPKVTVAKDIEDISELDMIISQAIELSEYAQNVIIVPKATELDGQIPKTRSVALYSWIQRFNKIWWF
jgi:hypothetical protein